MRSRGRLSRAAVVVVSALLLVAPTVASAGKGSGRAAKGARGRGSSRTKPKTARMPPRSRLPGHQGSAKAKATGHLPRPKAGRAASMTAMSRPTATATRSRGAARRARRASTARTRTRRSARLRTSRLRSQRVARMAARERDLAPETELTPPRTKFQRVMRVVKAVGVVALIAAPTVVASAFGLPLAGVFGSGALLVGAISWGVDSYRKRNGDGMMDPGLGSTARYLNMLNARRGLDGPGVGPGPVDLIDSPGSM